MNTTDKSLYEITGAIKDINTLLVGRTEIETLVRNAERLDWMIFHSAKVRHSSDGEFCTVTWYDDEGQAHVTKPFGSARQAIDAAMQEKTND